MDKWLDDKEKIDNWQKKISDKCQTDTHNDDGMGMRGFERTGRVKISSRNHLTEQDV